MVGIHRVLKPDPCFRVEDLCDSILREVRTRGASPKSGALRETREGIEVQLAL